MSEKLIQRLSIYDLPSEGHVPELEGVSTLPDEELTSISIPRLSIYDLPSDGIVKQLEDAVEKH